PNADKLSLTTVDLGAGRIVPIVCGAANVAAGQKVVVALPGSTLHPTAGEPFQIKSAKIRGEVSEGMICGEDEIGLGASHEGILVLPANAPVGKPAAEFFQIESDYQLEIGLTPNRADAASHIGAARDIKAATGRDIRWPSVDNFKPDNQALSISVAVENTDACPRYSGVTLSGVTVKESPAWLKNRLLSIGLTPINNVVDITNFVLHETGQPLHAFDADQIRGGQIVVKTLPAGTAFVTLDGKERKLSSNDLMICDREAGLCIAGVFGGLNSGISDKTKNIFLESACFAPSYVRKTGQLHQLKTDASFRFERGTDPNLTVYALKRAALLIRELAGGTISSDVVDVYPTKIQNRKIEVSYANINRLIGKVLPAARIHTILQSLDIEVMQATSQGFSASVPPYRVDVTQEADIVEEILRIYGFNNIELSEIAGTDYLAAFPEKASHPVTHTLGEMLSSQGLYEILTNSLTREAYQQRLNLSYGSEPVEVLNKLSEEQGILRQTLLFTGLEVLSHNINRKQKDIRLYEFGKVYGKTPTGYREDDRLALYISGNAEAENWRRPAQPAGYFDLTQAVVNVLQRCEISCEQKPVHDSQLEYGMA
ncbi:MAG: phenylalanine--tRNA ligase subunit beta, partial [Cyclobacteriaceae bacterium]